MEGKAGDLPLARQLVLDGLRADPYHGALWTVYAMIERQQGSDAKARKACVCVCVCVSVKTRPLVSLWLKRAPSFHFASFRFIPFMSCSNNVRIFGRKRSVGDDFLEAVYRRLEICVGVVVVAGEKRIHNVDYCHMIVGVGSSGGVQEVTCWSRRQSWPPSCGLPA